MGYGMAYMGFLNVIIFFGLTIWFVLFSLLVLSRLDKIIVLLSKK
jgi:hypothetical protein